MVKILQACSQVLVIQTWGKCRCVHQWKVFWRHKHPALLWRNINIQQLRCPLKRSSNFIWQLSHLHSYPIPKGTRNLKIQNKWSICIPALRNWKRNTLWENRDRNANPPFLGADLKAHSLTTIALKKGSTISNQIQA